ncbi:DUF6884 domain-containing protein [Mesorhizobium sp.]|uniref:DUF6884 domain-containing protein n=1 Tax=Mesorhizobium sp. TaxID=1871066 RepID=UPI0034471F87
MGTPSIIHAPQPATFYQGDLFKKSLAYARSLKPDAIYILSAKHGLVGLDDELDPYELTLAKMGVKERRAWAKGVCEQLSEHVDLTRDRLIFHLTCWRQVALSYQRIAMRLAIRAFSADVIG